MKNIAKIIFCTSVFCLLNGFAQAQHTETMSGIEKTKAKSLWFFGSGNAAGLTIDEDEFVDQLLLGFDRTSGDFKRVQAGEIESDLILKADGGLRLGEGYAWGNFRYARTTHRNTVWNAGLLNPFRNMPFNVIDPNVSDWQIQSYSMQMKISTPFMFGDRLALGLDVAYVNEIGAKQIDPRATNRFYSINVKPGVIYQINPSNFIGISGEFLNHREDYIPTNSNSQLTQHVFSTRGLGYSFAGTLGGTGATTIPRWTIKDLWGGEVQYGIKGNVNAMLAVGYRKSLEDMKQATVGGFVRDRELLGSHRFIGSVLGDELYANVSSTFGSENNLNLIKFNLSNASLQGIEYIQEMDTLRHWIVEYQSVRSTFDRMAFGASYDYFKGNSEADYSWRAGLFFNYFSNKDAYIYPIGTQNFTAMNFGINVKYNWAINSESQVLLGARIMRHNNLSKEFAYGGPNQNCASIVDFVIADFDMRTMDYNLFGAELTFHFRLQNMGFFAGQHLDYMTAAGGINRMFYSVKVGLTF